MKRIKSCDTRLTIPSFYLLPIARLPTERRNSEFFLRDIFVEIKMKYVDLNNYLNIICFKPVTGVVEVLILARADDNSIQLFSVPHIYLNKRTYHCFWRDHILIHFMGDFYFYNWLQNRTRKYYNIEFHSKICIQAYIWMRFEICWWNSM
jgi:hypothetical protein